jgi:uncharacterized protein HemY
MTEAKRVVKHFITLEYSKKAETVLKEHDIEFKREKLVELVNESEEAKKREERFHELKWVPVPPEIYSELDNLCNINNWDTNKHIITILRREVNSAEVVENEDGQKIVHNF